MTSPLKLHRDLPVKQNPLSHFVMIEFDVQIGPNTFCDAEHVFHEHWSGNSVLAGNVLKRSSGLSGSSDEPRGPGSLIPGAFGAAPTSFLLPRAPSTCQGKEQGCSGGFPALAALGSALASSPPDSGFRSLQQTVSRQLRSCWSKRTLGRDV